MRANLYKTVLSPNILQVFEAWKEMGCMDMHGPKSHLSIFCDFFCQDFSKQQTQYLTVEQALEDYAQLIRLLGYSFAGNRGILGPLDESNLVQRIHQWQSLVLNYIGNNR